MLNKLSQLSNAPSQTTVTLSGIFIDVKFLHPAKAPCHIFVTLSGIYTEDKVLQPEKR